MSEYATKNYTAQGGSMTVIGGELRILGKLTIDPGADVVGLPIRTVEVTQATPTISQPDSTATTVAQLRTDFNLLLNNLRAAGALAGDAP